MITTEINNLLDWKGIDFKSENTEISIQKFEKINEPNVVFYQLIDKRFINEKNTHEIKIVISEELFEIFKKLI